MSQPDQPSNASEAAPSGVEIDTSKAHSARQYDYLLGGKTNFAADRAAGDAFRAAFPEIVSSVIACRHLMHRVVRHCVTEFGIRQVLDIGTGIPTSPNVHEIAQSIAPESRIVYVDNDPIVLVHARALLDSTAEGATAYVEADLLKPAEILGNDELRATLDLSQPVLLLINGTLHFFPDDEQIYGVVRTFVDALAPGSFLALQHATPDAVEPGEAEAIVAAQKAVGLSVKLRTKDEFLAFFDGLELIPPGAVLMAEWRADDDPATRPKPREASAYAAVGRKN